MRYFDRSDSFFKSAPQCLELSNFVANNECTYLRAFFSTEITLRNAWLKKKPVWYLLIQSVTYPNFSWQISDLHCKCINWKWFQVDDLSRGKERLVVHIFRRRTQQSLVILDSGPPLIMTDRVVQTKIYEEHWTALYSAAMGLSWGN